MPELHLAQIFHWTRGFIAALAQIPETGLSEGSWQCAQYSVKH
ncbi:MAG TPA: hypothetical protein VIG36_07935 [Methylocystis sp.]